MTQEEDEEDEMDGEDYSHIFKYEMRQNNQEDYNSHILHQTENQEHESNMEEEDRMSERSEEMNIMHL